MTHKDFIAKVSETLNCTQGSAKQQVNAIFGLITTLLKENEDILIPEFGRFTVAQRSARMGRSPKTGEQIQIPAKTVPVFKPASQLKAQVSAVKPLEK